MTSPLRTFVAVHIRPTRPLRNTLDQLRRLGRTIKPVYDDNLHVTLKFLGDTAAEQIPRISEEIAAAVSGQRGFEMRMTGVGCFPGVERPRVVWAGLERAEPLIAIAAELERRLGPLGFPAETRPFHPHLTLARLRGRPPHDLPDLLARYADTDFGTAKIGSIVLYQSELRTHGPRYTPLATVELPRIEDRG